MNDLFGQSSYIAPARSIVIVGGGFAGALLGLKLHLARPELRVVIIERARALGRGTAYGACGPGHLLNVPISRMDMGLDPGFGAWLAAHPDFRLPAGETDMEAAFVPRRLFGDYMEERVVAALGQDTENGLTRVRGEAVRLATRERGVQLTDGRVIPADIVVLAFGNLPPRPPPGPDRWLYDDPRFVPDPWARDAFADLDPEEPLLLIGTGLTMVDVALQLTDHGHRGPMLAFSRRGLLPRRHQLGGAWPEFLSHHAGAPPRKLLRLVRDEIARAATAGVPWQRVFDAARPAIPGVWRGWSDAERTQFLRHLRARWDVHRHRMAPPVADALEQLMRDGALEVTAARIGGYARAGRWIEAALRLRGGATRAFRAGRVVNCTGPASALDQIAIPLVTDLRERRLVVPDALGIGFITDDSAVVTETGSISDWLFVIGPATRPAWWEITAAPEINLQIERLVRRLTNPGPSIALRAADFLDIGVGI